MQVKVMVPNINNPVYQMQYMNFDLKIKLFSNKSYGTWHKWRNVQVIFNISKYSSFDNVSQRLIFDIIIAKIQNLFIKISIFYIKLILW